MRIKAHLQHNGLIKYIKKLPIPLGGAAANAFAKKRAKVVKILMNYMSETTFKAVITPENEESLFNIWAQIIRHYASTSINNKGCI